MAGQFILLRLDTDDGVSGWGESTFHGRLVTVEALRSVVERSIGWNAFQTSAIWDGLFKSGFRLGTDGAHMAALSALDIALHDIKGRSVGVPVYELLGGKRRDGVELYSSLMTRHLSPAENVTRVGDRLAAGFSWVKLHTASPWNVASDDDDTVSCVEALRAAFGGRDKLQIMVDVNRAYSFPTALRVGQALEELEVFHFEEPLLPWDLNGYHRLQSALSIQIAAGEVECTLRGFKDLMVEANIDIIQPNITACGGYTQAMKIAALAETYSRAITCHNTEPSLMTAAHLHFWASCGNCIYPQEYYGEPNHPLLSVLDPPLSIREGQISIPDGPGLGINVDENELRRISDTTWSISA